MSQKALLMHSKHSPFELTTIPKPISAPRGELVVKIQASALNPADWKYQEYGWLDKYPGTVGFDIAGDVEHVGEGVTGFQKGDRVFFGGNALPEYAGYQQYTLVQAEIVGKIPAKISYSQASTIPVGFNTAAVGLYAKAPIGLGLNPDLESGIERYRGKPTLVIGGSTSVGQYALQLLRYLGFSTIITYASSHQFTHLKSLGATDLIDRKAVSLSDLPAAVKKITSIPIEVVYDAFGSAESQQAGYDSLADSGQMVIVLPDEIKNKTDGDGKKVLMVKGNAQIEPSREFVKVAFGEKLPRLIEEGIIVPNRVEDLPNGLEGIIDGLKRLKNNEVSGVKLVSHPQETK